MALKILISKTRAKINRKLLHLRLQPIRVFCFHQVSEVFDPSTMWECDWTEINQFKRNILKLKEDYIFISLPEAHEKLIHDRFRRKKYAVLTSDDGWASLQNILPWLDEQHIPVTLFLNPAYMLKQEKREKDRTNLLSLSEIQDLLNEYQSISVASHGWNHQLCSELSLEQFRDNVDRSESFMERVKNKIPFFAYPCGRTMIGSDSYLFSKDLVPVYCDGQVNCFGKGIHRECIDGKLF